MFSSTKTSWLTFQLKNPVCVISNEFIRQPKIEYDEFPKIEDIEHASSLMKCYSFGTLLLTLKCACIFLEITLLMKGIHISYITVKFYLCWQYNKILPCALILVLCVMSGMCTHITMTFFFFS
jgi:hypothetical protein